MSAGNVIVHGRGPEDAVARLGRLCRAAHALLLADQLADRAGEEDRDLGAFARTVDGADAILATAAELVGEIEAGRSAADDADEPLRPEDLLDPAAAAFDRVPVGILCSAIDRARAVLTLLAATTDASPESAAASARWSALESVLGLLASVEVALSRVAPTPLRPAA